MSRALAAALALAEHLLPARFRDGQQVVRVADAHVLLSGHAPRVVAAWEMWPEADKQRLGALLGIRHRGEALLHHVERAVHDVFHTSDVDDPLPSLYALWYSERGRALEVLPVHGQDPADVADRLLTATGRRRALRVASGSGWSAPTSRGRVQLAFPDEQGVYRPPRVVTAPSVDLVVDADELGWQSRDTDEDMEGPAFREKQIALLLRGTIGGGRRPLEPVVLPPGRMHLLSAPPGVGKNVFGRGLAIQQAGMDRTTVLVVSDNGDVYDEAATLQQELRAAGVKATATPFIAPNSRYAFALRSAAKLEGTGVPLAQASASIGFLIDNSAYGCAAQAQLEGRDLFEGGREPCTVTASDAFGQPERALCPYVSSCGKFSHVDAATTARIIVTTHACFQSGMIKVPVEVDGEVRNSISVREFLLRLASYVVVDEVDAYQSKGFDECGVLELASRSRPNTVLRQIRDSLHQAPPRLAVAVRRPLTRAVFLAEQLLDLVAGEEVCTEVAQARALARGQDPRRARQVVQDRKRWYQPHRWDRHLLENLIGVDAEAAATAEQAECLQALLPPVATRPGDRSSRAVLPDRLLPVPDVLQRMLTIDEGGEWQLAPLKDELREIISAALPACTATEGGGDGAPVESAVPAQRGSGGPGPVGVVTHAEATAGILHALMMKTWLTAIVHTMFDLTDRAGELAGHGIDAASTLADAIGHQGAGTVVPFGPLGRQLGGFRFEGLDDPGGHASLKMEVLRADPHTETQFLGSVVSLALSGRQRTVVGMSATGYMPGAARTHLLARPDWAMPDTLQGGLSIFNSTPVADGKCLAVGSTPYRERDQRVVSLAAGYAPGLVRDLARLAADLRTRHRARALVTVNSYRQARLFAQALYDTALALGRRLRIYVAVADTPDPSLPPVCDAIGQLTRDRFSELADLDGEVLISPLPRTERGLNVLTVFEGVAVSAITLIAMAVRPVMPADEAPVLAASVAARAWRDTAPGDDPAAVLARARAAAEAHLRLNLNAPKRFSALPDELKHELVATLLGQGVQLAGRGRRGQTHVELHFIDGAFHDPTWGSDLPTLVRGLLEQSPPGDLAQLGACYGHTIEEIAEYAHAQHLLPALRAGFHSYLGEYA
ncbi:hypothetical protein ACFWOG_12345 [Kitasatospora sp. NPDC058406]|uniref:hypothetical protein n=1 Tax=Kitasatospora sp. NPDC058406 TaxID=3346483 RepID=UPI00365508DD